MPQSGRSIARQRYPQYHLTRVEDSRPSLPSTKEGSLSMFCFPQFTRQSHILPAASFANLMERWASLGPILVSFQFPNFYSESTGSACSEKAMISTLSPVVVHVWLFTQRGQVMRAPWSPFMVKLWDLHCSTRRWSLLLCHLLQWMYDSESENTGDEGSFVTFHGEAMRSAL
jgi:hypothetical protein